MSPYNPTVGPGDVISLYGSRRPVHTGGRIATREGIKYGVSNMGNTFYQNGHFTGAGGATTGGLIGAASGAINGDSTKQIGQKAAIGAGRGYASNVVGNYAASQGGSAIASSAAGGTAGAMVGLIGNAFTGEDTNVGQMSASAIGGTIASGIAADAGAGSAAGPIGAAVGAAIGLVVGLTGNNVGPNFEEDYTWSGKTPVFYKDGKWQPSKIQGYHAKIERKGDVPAKYQGKFAQAHQARVNYFSKFLNNNHIKGDPRIINAFYNHLPGVNVGRAKHLRDFTSGKTFLDNFTNRVPLETSTTAARSAGPKISDLVAGLRGLSTGSHVLLENGTIMSNNDYKDYLNDFDGLDEGGDDGGARILRPMFNKDGSLYDRYAEADDDSEGS